MEVVGQVIAEEDDQYVGEGGANEPPQEKRIRREIANSNERRRMQSINSGFASLRTLLPHHEGGEKLSKAAILQQTAEYIYSLEQEKTRLLSQNCQLKRLIGQTQHMDTDETDSSPAPKRRLIDMGQKVLLEEEGEEVTEVQNKLERERRTRMALEERVRLLEGQLYQGGRRGVIQRYSADERLETMETMELMSLGQTHGQTVLTPGAKKQGLEALVLEQHDGGRVEVERIPELPHEQSQTVEIANVQDPETGATRQYIVTQMCDSTSAGKQNLETIVEAIRHLEGDHLFSEESGPHQVVKEEVVESCIIDDPDMEIQMTLASPQSAYTAGNIINSLPQGDSRQWTPEVSTYNVPSLIPGQGQYHLSSLSLPLSATLPTVPVASLHLGGQQGLQGIPVTVSNLVSSLQTPLPQTSFLSQQVPTTGAPLPPVTTLSSLISLPSLPLELPNIGPPQTSPVNLELGPGSPHPSGQGSLTPNSELSNSPPQSSPVNLAQPPLQHEN